MSSQLLLSRVTAYVKETMSHHDASHDFSHIRRVLSLAKRIARADPRPPNRPPYDHHLITLAALLHDINDRKYATAGADGATPVHRLLVDLGAPPAVAAAVQTITTHVAYSAERRDPAAVRAVLERHPELGVVQDADRLDALGAVGIGRTFTYGGARGAGGMEAAVRHCREKLEALEGLMKTAAGRALARERTERVRLFRAWWEEECGMAVGDDES